MLRRPSAAAPRQAAGALYSLAQWFKLQRYERRVLRGCDLVLAVSADDARIFRGMVSGIPVGVVPNGVDTSYFDRTRCGAHISLSPASIVFSGTLDYRPNVDAALWFADEVLPHIRAQRPRRAAGDRRAAASAPAA